MRIENVAIIGGGIAGLAAAILLSRINCRVTIYEKAPRPEPVGAGFLLQPPGQQILGQLGVLDKVLQSAVPILGLRSETTSGYKLLNLDYRDLGAKRCSGLGVQRHAIYQALYQAALDTGQISFEWGSEITNCLSKEDHVSVLANDGGKNFDLCILSCGSNSKLAGELFPKRIKNPYKWGCLWTTFHLPGELSPNLLHQRCFKSQKMMGILPVSQTADGYDAALYWSLKSEALADFNAQQFSTIKNEIMEFWPQASASVDLLNQEDFIPATYNDVWISKPYRGRLIAIGDAAHGTSPQLGQGCTMALLDAAVLTNNLATKGNIDDAFDGWWKSRKYQLAYVRYLSRFLTPLFQSDKMAFNVFRDWLVAPVGRVPPFYKMQLRTLASDVLLREKHLWSGVDAGESL